MVSGRANAGRLVLGGIVAGCVHTLVEEVVKIRRPPVFTGFIRNVAFADTLKTAAQNSSWAMVSGDHGQSSGSRGPGIMG